MTFAALARGEPATNGLGRVTAAMALEQRKVDGYPGPGTWRWQLT